MNQSPLIAITTDFGYQDGFTGVMKGVILSINPQARLVDVSHGVPRQDLFAGAMVLRNACSYFPPDTIHLVVVDPGVGTSRKAMVAVTDNARYVLPDNGLLTLVERITPIREAYALENTEFFLPQISGTFHGRDIFAPTAAHLSLGRQASEVGPSMTTWKQLDVPAYVTTANGFQGQVIYVDCYGNAFCNFDREAMGDHTHWTLRFEGGVLQGLKRTYGEAAPGDPLFLMGSGGLLEIAVNGGDACRRFGLKPGTKVTLTRS